MHPQPRDLHIVTQPPLATPSLGHPFRRSSWAHPPSFEEDTSHFKSEPAADNISLSNTEFNYFTSATVTSADPYIKYS